MSKAKSLSDVSDNLFVPSGQLEQLCMELGMGMEEARAEVLNTSAKLADIYSAGGSKSFWTNTELVALNVLLLNKCLRKKDAQAATDDIELFEKVLNQFNDRLSYLLSEKKFPSFVEYLTKLTAELGPKHTVTFRLLLDKCKQWATQKQVIPETPDDETLYRAFVAICKDNKLDMQQFVAKRLELAVNEIAKKETPTKT